MENEKLINIEIDGKQIAVPQGTTVLEAARKLGIKIPTLCHNDSLSKKAACRICIVEMSIEKRGETYQWIDASCVYRVEEGLVVETRSPKVLRERKVIIEMLIARAPDSEILNEIATELGADKNRFVSIDNGASKCILCGLCTRVCEEQVHVGCIGTAFRGIHKKVMTPYELASKTCIACGACAYLCPTGVIKMTKSAGMIEVDMWDVKIRAQACTDCGKEFASLSQMGKINPNVVLRKDIMDKCPDCRRKTAYILP
jgi:NADH dehydrogenase/NADH:ubiquinone oxidoreductase 75 kD subunit (chain G)